MGWLVLVIGELEVVEPGSVVGVGEVPGGVGKEAVVLVCVVPKEVTVGGGDGL